MNLNSLLINAYKNANKTDSTNSNEEKNNGFEKVGLDFQIKNRQILGEKTKTVTSYKGDEQTEIAAKALLSGGLIKVPELPREIDGRESVYRRVAKFLLLIGIDEASKILPRLSTEQTEKIIPEIASIRHVDPSEAEVILKEFQSLFVKTRENSGVDTAREMLEKAFGAEKADELLANAKNNIPLEKPFDYLSEADGEKVSILLKDESNATRALVLSYLKPKVSADVIKSLSDEDKKDVILRMAKLSKINPEVLKAVDKAMHEKVNKLTVQKTDSIDGRSALAQILRRMDTSSGEEILGVLAEHDEELGSDLRNRLFTTDDIIAADDRYIQEYLRKIDDKDIAYIIAGKKDDFRNKILKNVSQTRGNSVLEYEEFNKPMRRSDVNEKTTVFIDAMRQAYESGDLIISGRDGELYV